MTPFERHSQCSVERGDFDAHQGEGLSRHGWGPTTVKNRGDGGERRTALFPVSAELRQPGADHQGVF